MRNFIFNISNITRIYASCLISKMKVHENKNTIILTASIWGPDDDFEIKPKIWLFITYLYNCFCLPAYSVLHKMHWFELCFILYSVRTQNFTKSWHFLPPDTHTHRFCLRRCQTLMVNPFWKNSYRPLAVDYFHKKNTS